MCDLLNLVVRTSLNLESAPSSGSATSRPRLLNKLLSQRSSRNLAFKQGQVAPAAQMCKDQQTKLSNLVCLSPTLRIHLPVPGCLRRVA